MTTQRYQGETYLPLDQLYARYRSLAQAHPEWMKIETLTETRAGHPIYLITLSALCSGAGVPIDEHELLNRPALWVDAGTHCAEWAGIAAALIDVEAWLSILSGRGEDDLLRDREREWFSSHAIYLIPVICPDGYVALWGGAPYLRSTLRDHRGDLVEAGMSVEDLDGDGVARWMRWRHPAGPFVEDESAPGLMRGRTLDDDPSGAYFMCMEGTFKHWDGWRWEEAPRAWVQGLDLNRNFPAHWQNFSMFGMDGGLYPLSETESRAVVDAFATRPRIAAAITYHTFTGALLTQPYRKNSPLSSDDIRLMEAIGQQSVADTGYRVIRIHPDFVYDENAEVVGVWSDTLSTIFGVPGYTLELWDPFKRNGIENHKPAQFFRDPDPNLLRGLVAGFLETPDAWQDWAPFDHPQLGAVELGGLDFMMTVRNPPAAELSAECHRAHLVTERLRRTLPLVTPQVSVEVLIPAQESSRGQYSIQLKLENTGFLSTSALDRGALWSGCPHVSAQIKLAEGDDCEAQLLGGAEHQRAEHLAGWGVSSLGLGGLNPSLPAQGHRCSFEWRVSAPSGASITLLWSGGRGGAGQLTTVLP